MLTISPVGWDINPNNSVYYDGSVFCAEDIAQGQIKSTLQKHNFLL